MFMTIATFVISRLLKRKFGLGPESSFDSRLSTEAVDVLQPYFLRQNPVIILYFTSGMMGAVGTVDIDAL